MLKKIMLVIMIMVLMCCSVFALPDQANKDMKENNKPDFVKEKSNVHGLENAVMHVKSEEQKQHLTQVMERVQTKQRQQLNNLSNVTIEENEENNSVKVRAKAKAKFMKVIPFKKEVEYNVNENGEIALEKQSWVEKHLIQFNQKVEI